MKRLAISIGDVNGIGPEVSLRAANLAKLPGVRLVLVGNAALCAREARRLGLPVPEPWEPDSPSNPRTRVSIWDPSPHRLRLHRGKVDPEAALAALSWIRAAALACLRGAFDGMVTAPICKEGLMAAGLSVPGHTEFLAELSGTARFAMMLSGGGLRVVPVTRHIPLREVPATLSKRMILEHIRLVAEALPWLGAPRKRIAVCGLNPHAGDGGAIGDEELLVIRPAVNAARRLGLSATGPLPADAVFHRELHGEFDAVICMYHDQGLTALKTIAFDKGVNITLGLPFVRTSPDHGTAFDIAGRKRADSGSMLAAITVAAELAGRANPWKRRSHK